MEEVKRIFDLLAYSKERYSIKEDLLAGKDNGEWVKYSIEQYIENANLISYGLLELGVTKGDKIASISNSRPEWNMLDMAIMQIGAVHVPIYPTISEADYKYILNHSEVQYVFVSGKDLLRKIDHIYPEVPNIKGIYTFKHIDEHKHLSELIALGKANQKPEKLDRIKADIGQDDLATMIYTSGTTGNPKGVMLSHKNLVSNFVAVSNIPPVDQYSKALSYLPLCHVYERMLNYMYQYLGISIYYAESMGTIMDNIQEVKPHIMTTVPRLLEKIYDRIIQKGNRLKGIQKTIFFWAVNLGQEYEIEGMSVWYKLKLSIARKLVFSKWLEAMGGRLRVMVSGGAALQARLGRVFWAAGINILEGYGLTEASPVIAVSSFEHGQAKIGTVGPPLRGIQVKISEQGELLAKGSNIMLGYYKDPEQTAEAIDKDGWLHTGDVAEMENGLVKITGRLKTIFKTSMGKYISPEHIENKLVESPFIDNAFVVGENQKFAAALIVPDFPHLRDYCKVKGIKYTNDAEIVKDPVIKKRFEKEVAKYNSSFGDWEKIKKIQLIDHEWSLPTGELTASLKKRRKFIYEKYQGQVDQLFI